MIIYLITGLFHDFLHYKLVKCYNTARGQRSLNNGGYDPYANYDLGYPQILKRKNTMEPEAYYTLNNYLYGLTRCDKALGYFVESIDKIEEPVVFLYFADHQPFLGENFMGYKAIGFNISQTGNLEAYLNHYETPYFIYCNQSAKKLLSGSNVPVLKGAAPQISTNYLATELLKYIGLYGGPYFSFLSELKNDIPVITSRFYKIKDSFTENLTDEVGLLLEKYRNLQYYMLLEPEAEQ